MIGTIIFGCLFLGFYLLFYQAQMLEWICGSLKKTQGDMDMAARLKALENKRRLAEIKEKYALWFRLKQWLYYSGIKQRFPGITPEFWVSGNLVVIGLVSLFSKIFLGIGEMIVITSAFIAAQLLLMQYLRSRNMRAVNENLMKLLKLLGNYRITAPEVANVFHHVSRYMEEPIRTTLEECYLETLVTGDVGMALLSMEEKIEHPQFKAFARNIEIAVRYCADFTALINGSRHSMMEYLHFAQKKKTMLRNIALKTLLLIGIVLLLFMGFQRVYA